MNNTDKTNITIGKNGLVISNIDELMRFARAITDSEICPKQFKGKPGDAMIAMVWGYELGLSPMNSLNNIAVIKGKPSLYGDALPGLIQSSGKMEYFKEEFIGAEFDDDFGCKVTSKRKDNPFELITIFTVADAKKAGLWDDPEKKYTWGKYPKRMLLYRARAFNFRDNFADVLQGISTVEEVQDYVDADYEIVQEQKKSLDNKIAEKKKELDIPVEDDIDKIFPVPEKEEEKEPVEIPNDEYSGELKF